MNYITPAEFEQFNPELDFSQYTNATISGMISRASKYMDSYLQYTLQLEAVVDEKAEAVVNSTGELVVYTRKLNIQSVQSIKLNVGPTAVELQLLNGNGQSNVQIPSRRTSMVYPWMPFAWTGTVAITNFFSIRSWDIYATVAYTAGYADIPDDLKDACNLLTKDIFIRQSNPQNLSSMRQGGISMSFNTNNNPEGKSWMKLQAESMMNEYKRVVGV